MALLRIRIKKGDTVEVLAGKDKGKRGTVLRTVPKKEGVIVEKVNFVHRHRRPTSAQRQGGILEIEAPVHASNVGLVCPGCDRPVRIGIKFLEDGSKARVCKKCGEVIE